MRRLRRVESIVIEEGQYLPVVWHVVDGKHDLRRKSLISNGKDAVVACDNFAAKGVRCGAIRIRDDGATLATARGKHADTGPDDNGARVRTSASSDKARHKPFVLTDAHRCRIPEHTSCAFGFYVK